MPKNTVNIEQLSDEVQDILGSPPQYLVRSGTIFLFLFLTLIILGSWVVEYPTIISAPVEIVTTHPLAPIMARNSGHLTVVFVTDSQLVYKNEVLAVISNAANYKDMLYLKSLLVSIKPQILRQQYNFTLPQDLQLGEVQASYFAFVNAFDTYAAYLKENRQEKEVSSLELRVKSQKKYKSLLKKQVEIKQKEYELEKKKVWRYQIIYNKGVISDAEYEENQKQLLQIESYIASVEASIIQIEMQLDELVHQIEMTKIKYDKENLIQKIALTELIKKLESNISSWFDSYVLIAPIDGIVAFNKLWSANQFAEIGSQIFTVIPNDQGKLIGRISISCKSAGKVEISQWVNIKFDEFPYQEFGYVTAVVKSKSLVSLDNEYIIEVGLPFGLKTSYSKNLVFTQKMKGTAEIVTKDERLLMRFINPLRAFFDN